MYKEYVVSMAAEVHRLWSAPARHASPMLSLRHLAYVPRQGYHGPRNKLHGTSRQEGRHRVQALQRQNLRRGIEEKRHRHCVHVQASADWTKNGPSRDRTRGVPFYILQIFLCLS